jgi:hypothetical protein
MSGPPQSSGGAEHFPATQTGYRLAGSIGKVASIQMS